MCTFSIRCIGLLAKLYYFFCEIANPLSASQFIPPARDFAWGCMDLKRQWLNRYVTMNLQALEWKFKVFFLFHLWSSPLAWPKRIWDKRAYHRTLSGAPLVLLFLETCYQLISILLLMFVAFFRHRQNHCLRPQKSNALLLLHFPTILIFVSWAVLTIWPITFRSKIDERGSW